MEVNDPDLDAFQSATRQLQARELGKIEAFIPNLWPNASVPVSPMGNLALNAAHHLTSSLIGTNHLKISKNPQNGFFKVFFPSVPTDGAQMKLMKRKFRQWWNSNIYQNFIIVMQIKEKQIQWMSTETGILYVKA